MSRVGLRGRLAAAFGAVIVISFVASFFAVHRATESELKDRLDRDLRSEATDLEAALHSSPPQSPQEILTAARDYIDSQGFGRSEQVLAVEVPGAGVATNQPELLGVGGLSERESPQDIERERAQGELFRTAPGGLSDLHVEDVGEVRVLTQALPSYPGGPEITVRVGQPVASIERALDGLSRAFLLVGSVTLAAALALAIALAIRIAGPLRRMARSAGEIDGGELSRRVEVPGSPEEVHALAVSFNGMLDRLEGAFARQRGFVSDASHELRTPLTVIRGQLEVLNLADRPDPDEVERVSAVVIDEVERMERLVEDMLVLARGDEALHLEIREAELRELVKGAVEVTSVMAPRRFEFGRLDPGSARVDADLLGRLVRILIRNSIEHTERDGRIRVSVSKEGESWLLQVEDDGPGIPPDLAERVFERFYRTDESRGRSTGGAGLGLAIARTIAEAHRGSIAALGSELGGARIDVRIRSLP